MSAQTAFRSALFDGDTPRMRKMWKAVFPKLPQFSTTAAARVSMHTARTAAESLPLQKRLYSHAWLEERGYRSSLPEDLQPDPVPLVVHAGVGISINTANPDRKDECRFIERIMAEAAGNAMADNLSDAEVSKIMWQARRDVMTRTR